MSTYILQRLRDLPAILHISNPEWTPSRDMAGELVEFREMLDRETKPVFVIGDLSESRLSLSEAALSVHMAAADGNAVLRHPHLRELLMVTTQKIVEMAALGLNAAAFGYVPVRVFAALPDALAYVREQVSIPPILT